MIVPLMTAWMKAQYGIPDSLSGPILGISSIVVGVSTLAAPALAKRFGVVNAIVVTEAISTVFMFATPLSPNYIIASFVYTSRAFLMNMSSPLAQSMIMGLVPEDERGAASGISAALWRLPERFEFIRWRLAYRHVTSSRPVLFGGAAVSGFYRVVLVFL